MIPYIDLHCDTISAIASGGASSLRENSLHIDLQRLRRGGAMAQTFASFVELMETEKRGETPWDCVTRLLDLLDSELERNADLIRPALTAEDIRRNFSGGFLSAIRSTEEGAVYMDDPARLRALYDRGVRIATLTWNHENGLAFPNRPVYDPQTGEAIGTVPETEHGLKARGAEFVRAMEEMGMLIDISHLGDAGIDDVFSTVRPSTPVIASHSNARSVAGHPRNLSDKHLKQIAAHGGVAGINFYHAFLSDTRQDQHLSALDDMIAHIRYIRNLIGTDHIAIGSDMDGISSVLEIGGCEGMQRLADALSASGFSGNEIDKIFFQNALRVFGDVWKQA
ncbi:MAG: membrane dipeptidase [Clostridia bacterium]|nr:membrane dipeptidase [Clostridia bacterium]